MLNYFLDDDDNQSEDTMADEEGQNALDETAEGSEEDVDGGMDSGDLDGTDENASE